MSKIVLTIAASDAQIETTPTITPEEAIASEQIAAFFEAEELTPCEKIYGRGDLEQLTPAQRINRVKVCDHAGLMLAYPLPSGARLNLVDALWLSHMSMIAHVAWVD